MEKHIFKFGNSSMAIILPKKWVDKNKLKASDGIFITESNKGELVLSTESSKKTTQIKAIDKKTDPEIVARFVSLYYMRGTSKLIIRSKDGLLGRQIDEVQSYINKECPGFEIISQSNNEIQIEDFTDIKEIDINKILVRLRSLINQEFIELERGNIATLARIEELVDRFYMLGIRYVNIVQPADVIKYYRTIIFMENIADDLWLIAPSVAKISRTLIGNIKKMFELSENGFNGNQKAILEVAVLRKEVRRYLEKAKLDRVYKRIIKDIANSSSQISEFGLLEEDNRFAL